MFFPILFYPKALLHYFLSIKAIFHLHFECRFIYHWPLQYFKNFVSLTLLLTPEVMSASQQLYWPISIYGMSLRSQGWLMNYQTPKVGVVLLDYPMYAERLIMTSSPTTKKSLLLITITYPSHFGHILCPNLWSAEQWWKCAPWWFRNWK